MALDSVLGFQTATTCLSRTFVCGSKVLHTGRRIVAGTTLTFGAASVATAIYGFANNSYPFAVLGLVAAVVTLPSGACFCCTIPAKEIEENVEALQTEVTNLDGANKALAKQVEELTQQRESLSEAVEDERKGNQALRDQLAQQSKSLGDTAGKLKIDEANLNKILTQYQNFTELQKKTATSLRDMTEKYLSLQEECTALLKVVQASEHSHQKATDDLKKLEEARQGIGSLSDQLNETLKKLTDTNGSLDQTLQEMQRMQEQDLQLMQSMEEFGKRNTQLEELLKQQIANREEQTKLIVALTERLKGAQPENANQANFTPPARQPSFLARMGCAFGRAQTSRNEVELA